MNTAADIRRRIAERQKLVAIDEEMVRKLCAAIEIVSMRVSDAQEEMMKDRTYLAELEMRRKS